MGILECILKPKTSKVPFQAKASCSLGGGSACTSDIFTVPSGKLAVVEYASVIASLPVDNGVRASVRTTLNSVEVDHQLYGSEVSPVPVIGGRRGMSAGQVVRLYADPETTIRMTGGTLGSNTGGIEVSVNFTISGHLVDMP